MICCSCGVRVCKTWMYLASFEFNVFRCMRQEWKFYTDKITLLLSLHYAHRFFISIIKTANLELQFSLSSICLFLSQLHNILLLSIVILSSRSSSIFPAMTVRSILYQGNERKFVFLLCFSLFLPHVCCVYLGWWLLWRVIHIVSCGPVKSKRS